MNGFFDLPSDLQYGYLGLVGLHLREGLIPVLAGLLIALPVAQLCVRFRWVYPPSSASPPFSTPSPRWPSSSSSSTTSARARPR